MCAVMILFLKIGRFVFQGCARSLEDELRRQMLIISAAALAIALIQVTIVSVA
jgi:hypothetical protein